MCFPAIVRFDEAISTLEAAAGMSGRHSLALTALAGVFGQVGKPAEARARGTFRNTARCTRIRGLPRSCARWILLKRTREVRSVRPIGLNDH